MKCLLTRILLRPSWVIVFLCWYSLKNPDFYPYENICEPYDIIELLRVKLNPPAAAAATLAAVKSFTTGLPPSKAYC